LIRANRLEGGQARIGGQHPLRGKKKVE
jgi:hypothetical protein